MKIISRMANKCLELEKLVKVEHGLKILNMPHIEIHYKLQSLKNGIREVFTLFTNLHLKCLTKL